MLCRIYCRSQFPSLSRRQFSTTFHALKNDEPDVKESPPKKSRPLPPTKDERQRQMREEFYRREAEWEAMVDLDKLSEDEKVIHRWHKEAVAGKHRYRKSPK